MSRPFYRLGLQLHIVDEGAGELLLEGRCRLQPGRVVAIGRHGGDLQRVLVTEWRVVGTGSDGLAYRGRGRILGPVRDARVNDGRAR